MTTLVTHRTLRALLGGLTCGIVLALSGCSGNEAPLGSGAPAQVTPSSTPAPATTPAGGQLAVRVDGNHLVDGAGRPVRLVGINRMTQTCMRTGSQGSDFYGPYDASSLAALDRWHINTVRITLGEDCWLGINGAPAATSGQPYRSAIADYVRLVHQHGMYMILDLHANAPGNLTSMTGQVMADADHAPAFWQSVATTFGHDPAVIFEPYNEPRIDAKDTLSADPWQCWLTGCTATVFVPQERAKPVPLRWQTAGMQQLVDTIRATGAKCGICRAKFAVDVASFDVLPLWRRGVAQQRQTSPQKRQR